MAVQPKISKFIPVAFMIALFAGGTVWVATVALGAKWAPITAVWALFISWAVYFAGGAKLSRAHKYAIGLVGGVVIGWLTLYVADLLKDIVGGNFNLPLAVFFAAFSIVMLELTDWFEYAPSYFFGYAGYFAYIFNPNYGSANGATYESFSHVINFSILLLIGLVLGFITSSLREMILGMEHVPLEERQTVFDEETR